MLKYYQLNFQGNRFGRSRETAKRPKGATSLAHRVHYVHNIFVCTSDSALGLQHVCSTACDDCTHAHLYVAKNLFSFVSPVVALPKDYFQIHVPMYCIANGELYI